MMFFLKPFCATVLLAITFSTCVSADSIETHTIDVYGAIACAEKFGAFVIYAGCTHSGTPQILPITTNNAQEDVMSYTVNGPVSAVGLYKSDNCTLDTCSGKMNAACSGFPVMLMNLHQPYNSGSTSSGSLVEILVSDPPSSFAPSLTTQFTNADPKDMEDGCLNTASVTPLKTNLSRLSLECSSPNLGVKILACPGSHLPV